MLDVEGQYRDILSDTKIECFLKNIAVGCLGYCRFEIYFHVMLKRGFNYRPYCAVLCLNGFELILMGFNGFNKHTPYKLLFCFDY